jgi:hypothetical protein
MRRKNRRPRRSLRPLQTLLAILALLYAGCLWGISRSDNSLTARSAEFASTDSNTVGRNTVGQWN